MDEKLRILFLEDSSEDVALIEHILKKEDIDFLSKVVDTREEYRDSLLEFSPDVVISDHSLPQFNSVQALEIYQEYRAEYNPAAAFILVTGTVSEEFAVDIMKRGADDYILKDRLKRLPSAIRNAYEKNRSREEKRRAEEEKFQLLDILQKSLHEIYVFDPNKLQLQYVNEEGLRNLGYAKEEIEVLDLQDLILDFDEEKSREILKSVERSRKGRIYEMIALRKDKTTYPIQIHLQIVKYGNKKHFLANVLDITESREHQRQKEMAQFIQNCFSENRSLHDSLAIICEELGKQSNMSAVEVWAKDIEDSDIKCYASWTADQHPSPKGGRFFADRVFKSGQLIRMDNLSFQDFMQSGKVVTENFYKGVVVYPIISGGEVTAVINLFTDDFLDDREAVLPIKEGVQDKLASNIKRKKTEEELQKIFQFSPDVLAVTGKEGYFRKISPSFEKIMGYSESEVLKRPFVEFMHPDDLVIFEEWQNKELKEDEVAHYESRWLDKKGDYHWFSWSVTNFLKGGLQFAVGKDITEFRKQVEAIELQNKKLAQIAWEQSHTVRAPLSRLLACVDYIEEKEMKKDPLLASIKETAHELDEIVRSIVAKADQLL